jgi:hypothetical protein
MVFIEIVASSGSPLRPAAAYYHIGSKLDEATKSPTSHEAAAMQQSIAIHWGMYCRIFASSWRGL